MNTATAYKRILVKLSGEALSPTEARVDNKPSPFDSERLVRTAKELIKTAESGCQTAVVIGAGNIWRGKNNLCFSDAEADAMGMLATVINSVALRSTIAELGYKAKLFTSVAMPSIGDTFNSVNAIRAMEEGYIVIIGGGTGNPFFTTDTAAVLRALELSADIALFAKDVDAIYDRDPDDKKSKKPLNRFRRMNYSEILERNLKAIDLTAAALCREKNMDIAVFDLKGEVGITDIVTKTREPGTFISNSVTELITENVVLKEEQE